MTALAIVEALQALADERQGRITPQLVVETAQNPESPLHTQFVWNDTKAAHLHRINQARELIRGVRINVRTERTTITAVAYVRDPELPPKVQGYISVPWLRQNTDASRDAIVAEFSSAAAHLRRARDLATALGLSNEIQDVMARLDIVQDVVMSDTQRAD